MSGLSLHPAQAGYIVTLDQVGSNVVAAGNGPLDLTGLSFFQDSFATGGLIEPFSGLIRTGPLGNFSIFHGTFSGPTPPNTFGNGGGTFADSGTGDIVGLSYNGVLVVPQGYVSNNPLSDSSTYLNATFSSLGVTPGTYEWTWGTGVNQNFTLEIGVAAVPDTGSTFGLLVVALSGVFGVSRFRQFRLA